MKKRGFILLESMLGLTVMLILGMGVLRTVTACNIIMQRNQAINEALTLALQEYSVGGTVHERLQVTTVQTATELRAGVSLQKKLIQVYDYRQNQVLSLVVYE